MSSSRTEYQRRWRERWGATEDTTQHLYDECPSFVRTKRSKVGSEVCGWCERHSRATDPVHIEARFMAKFTVGDGCWEWTAAQFQNGYGSFQIPGNGHRRAHRIAYELLVGPIPDGLQLDHLCRNRLCVRPSHLEPVTARENSLRSDNRAAQEARRTHCIHGHPFDDRNTGWRKDGSRRCRACAYLRTMKRAGLPPKPVPPSLSPVVESGAQ